MASTKIINVLKDDSFTEILDLFRATPAEEVIIVLPKRSKAFNKESHFDTLKETASEVGKTASFLCSNPDVNDLAKEYGFEVLLPRSTTPARKAPARVSMVNEIENFYDNPPKAIAEEGEIKDMDENPEEPEEEEQDFTPDEFEEEDNEDEEMTPELQRMADVVHPANDEKRPVKISSHRERESSVDVHHDFMTESLEARAISEIRGRNYADPDTPTEEESEREDRKWSNWLHRSSAPNLMQKTDKVKAKRRAGDGNRHKRLLIVMGSATAVFMVFAFYIATSSAKVTISPKSQDLDFQMNVTAGADVSSVDATNFKIPGQLFDIQKTVSQTFPATGKELTAQKAQGTITIHNTLGANQSLVATTRFESSDGHVFRTLANVLVPAGKTVNVQVVAAASGADYNVAAGKFTIPAFKEQNNPQKYNGIYGETNAAMHGGTSGEATVVSQQDYDSAKSALTSSAAAAAQDELKSELDGLTTIGNPTPDTSSVSADPQVGDAADNFNMSIVGSIQTMGFKPSDLDQVINAYVQSKNNLTIVPDKLTLTYSNVQFDSTAKTVQFTVSVTGPGYAPIDTSNLSANLEGKNDTQIKDYLKSIPGIQSAEVNLYPFFRHSVPSDPSRIHINVAY